MVKKSQGKPCFPEPAPLGALHGCGGRGLSSHQAQERTDPHGSCTVSVHACALIPQQWDKGIEALL